MNVIFHLVSALAAALLTVLLLRAQKQRDFMRELLVNLRQTPGGRLHVEAPAQFLERFAATLGIPFESESPSGKTAAPAKILAKPLTELYLSAGLALIRCKDTHIELQVEQGGAGIQVAALASALGGVEIKII